MEPDGRLKQGEKEGAQRKRKPWSHDRKSKSNGGRKCKSKGGRKSRSKPHESAFRRRTARGDASGGHGRAGGDG